jgi:hypothetical protein
MSAILSFYIFCGTVAVSYGVVLVLRIDKSRESAYVIIINYYVVEGQAPGACNIQMPSDLDR